MADTQSGNTSDTDVSFALDKLEEVDKETSLSRSDTEQSEQAAYIDVPATELILTKQMPLTFAYGFAMATLFILLTYGVFKAFGLVRIKSN